MIMMISYIASHGHVQRKTISQFKIVRARIVAVVNAASTYQTLAYKVE